MRLLEILPLERPFIWLDVETHSKLPPETTRIIELGLIVFYHDGREPKRWESFIDPGEKIHADVTELHTITDEDVFGKPKFKDIAESLAKGMVDCDFGGYNVMFDLRCVSAEMRRAGVAWSYEGAYVVDPLRVWQVFRPRRLADAVREFAKREPTDSHRALADTQDAVDALIGMLQTFQEAPRSVKALHELCKGDSNRIDPEGKFVWFNGEASIGFGKWGMNRTPLRLVPRDYLEWMTKADFSPEVKRIAAAAAKGVFPKRESDEKIT